MPRTIPFFRDTLTVDQSVFSALQARPGDTLVLAGRQVTLFTLAPEFDFIIAADHLIVAPNAGTRLTGVAGNPSPSITVLARSIEGSPLVRHCRGHGRNRWRQRRGR